MNLSGPTAQLVATERENAATAAAGLVAAIAAAAVLVATGLRQADG